MIEIRTLLAAGVSVDSIAARYELNVATIADIEHRRSWAWVGREPDRTPEWVQPTHYSNPNPRRIATLTADDVVVVKELLSKGVLQSAISKQFGVRDSTISRINTGHQWRSVK